MGNFTFVNSRSRFKRFSRFNSIVCNSVDKSRFTFSPDGTVGDKDVKLDDEARLVKDFKTYFSSISGVDSKEKIMLIVNSSKEAAEWYKKWSNYNSIASSLPDFLDKMDVNQLEQWKAAEANKRSFDDKQKVWSTRISEKASELKALVKQVENEKMSAFNALDHMVLINLLSQNHLSTGDAAQLANETDPAKRKKLAKQLVTALQKSHLAKSKQETIDLLK